MPLIYGRNPKTKVFEEITSRERMPDGSWLVRFADGTEGATENTPDTLTIFKEIKIVKIV